MLNTQKTLTGFIVLTLMLLLFFYQAAEANECLNCHTNPGKLIKITREIDKDRPVIESKSKGPG